jgi:hypothetical protein
MSTRGYGDRWWDGGSAIPADLEKTDTSAAASAAATSKDSYTKKIKLALIKNKRYTFYFTYNIEDPETKKISESDRSPIVTHTFDIPNLTKPVQNLTLTAGSQSYGVKFNLDPESVQEDVVIFESLTSNFATQTIVYTGASTNVSILTTGPNAFAPRWIKVRSRDRWDDLNISEVTAGPVTPFSADVDTTYTVENPASSSASASIDPKDLSGFSLVSTISWVQSTNVKTAGYAIRWSTDNPETVTSPLWEYASVSGITTTSFTATGLIPNTTYYYQVASTTPYDVVSWTGAASGTFIASDADGTAAGALARLKSFIAIGGASQDLFKIGTGISQSINLNTDPIVSPTLTAGTYHGIILNKSTTNVGNNFWLTTGQFRVGNPTEFMYWNGTNLYLTGSINATGGKFTGNVQLAIPAGATTSGTLFAGANPTSGARVRFSSEGIFAYDATSTDNATGQTFSLVQSTGRLNANLGTVGGWTLATTGLSSGGSKIESSGNISLGNNPQASLQSIVRLSADDPTYRLWIGSQVAQDAPFKVTKEGKLYATGAVFGGYATTAYADGIGTAAASDATTKANAAQSAAATDAQTRAAAAQAAAIASAATDAQTRATNARDAAILASVAKTDFNKDEIIKKINNSTVSTSIDGGLITTGTLKAEAVVTNFISAFEIEATKIKVGTLTGHILQAGLTGTSYYLNTKGTKDGIDGLVVNAIGIESSRTGGVFTHWYPYYSGTTANYDLGVAAFPWNDGRFAGNVYVGYRSQDTPGTGGTGASAGPRIRLYSTGPIFANTLGTGTGNSIVQDGGFLKVQVSSSRYKENIIEINKSGQLDILNSLKPVTYNYIGDTGHNGGPRNLSGLIAEDLHQIPQLRTVVNYNEENQPDGIAYDRLTAHLILAIQELSDKVDSISSRLDALES